MNPLLNRIAIGLACLVMLVLVGLDAMDIFRGPAFTWNPVDWSLADWIGTSAHLFAMIFSLGAIVVALIFMKKQREGRAWTAIVAGYLVWPISLGVMIGLMLALGVPEGLS